MVRKIVSFTVVAVVSFLSSLSLHAQLQPGQMVKLTIGESGMALSVENSSLSESAKTMLWTDTDTPSQCWEVCEYSNGTVLLKNVYTGYYLGGLNSMVQGTIIGQITERADASSLSTESLLCASSRVVFLIASSSAKGSYPLK